jgi:hypothetical protein
VQKFTGDYNGMFVLLMLQIMDAGAAAELLTVLSAVKSAVEAGDLDAQIDSASAAVRERFAQ